MYSLCLTLLINYYIFLNMKAVCLHMQRPIYKSRGYSNVLWGHKK